MENALFSILIANYNNGKYLQECIDSIFAQSYTNWEIIIVDDASSDVNSFKIYKKYQENNQIKIYYNKENNGCGYTKKKCIEVANGEICGFVDPDDTLTPNALELMIALHEQNPNCSLIYSTHFVCNELLDIKNISNLSKVIRKGETHLTDSSISHFATFKKKHYKNTNGLNPELIRAVDQDLYLKLEEVGLVIYVNEPLYYYRQHNNGISTFNNELNAEYWNWMVRIEAAKRRNINIENYFSDFYSRRFEAQKNRVKNTIDYKLGNLILKPLRIVKRFFNV